MELSQLEDLYLKANKVFEGMWEDSVSKARFTLGPRATQHSVECLARDKYIDNGIVRAVTTIGWCWSCAQFHGHVLPTDEGNIATARKVLDI